ncbi:MAG: hypothetical protein PHS73_01975 [Candidatus Peribacteraceae bacterium]|nr:hypothetical protein [Candidatus Peribacteraceae bacterium]
MENPPDSSSASGRPCLLIAEDTPFKRSYLEEAVSVAARHVDVRCCERVDETIEFLLQHAHEVVFALVDYSFTCEGKTGIEIIRALRTANRYCYIMLVTSTDIRATEFKVREAAARLAGANEAISMNMLPHLAGDWIDATLRDLQREGKLGFPKGSPEHSIED